MSQALHYTSTYQMTYLFIQHTLGRVQDQILFDSLEMYLFDLHEAISTASDNLKPVEDAVTNYFEQETYGEGDFKTFLANISATIEKSLGASDSWDAHVKSLVQYFLDILKPFIPSSDNK